MNRYQFEMPFPPSVNGYWRSFKGRQIISKKGREYRLEVAKRMDAMKLDNELLSGRLDVYVRMHPPCKRKRDVDNYLKAPLDALTHCKFWEDDEQIDKLCISRADKVKGGKLLVTVKVIDE